MRVFFSLLLAAFAMSAQACPENLDFSFRPLLGKEPVRLCDHYAGKVVLVVNTASQCGFTHQYEGLEKLYKTYGDRGLVVLGFPSNDFGGQEPGTEAEIQKFCRSTYGIQFPMFEKTSVQKGGGNLLFQRLAAVTGEAPKWNFHKYLLDREGKVVKAFGSMTGPDSDRLRAAIESLL
jgi:glutathione peroxidase